MSQVITSSWLCEITVCNCHCGAQAPFDKTCFCVAVLCTASSSSHNDLGAGGAAALAGSLQGMGKMTTLNLRQEWGGLSFAWMFCLVFLCC
mmetsp:Transcript_36974/g.98259  ORF Transcript_36974/g.98259 Transcript_36974/m.98259 type:complete len:91 (+) Transcript_36974:3874-4146(+)